MSSSLSRIEEYLAALPDDKRRALEALREVIRRAAPEAIELISYGVPAFRLNGPLVGYGATARHCALYLMSSRTVDDFAQELEGFSTSKGTIRFDADKPLSEDLVRRMVEARVEENARLKALD